MTSFPLNPKDEEIFKSFPDVYYQYDQKSKSWIRIPGYGKTTDLATPLRDGLMSKKDYQKIQGLLIPPPQITLTAEDCSTTFDSGIIGFRSSKGHLQIKYELSLITKDEKGNPKTEEKAFKIHENTYGIDFRVDVNKLIKMLEEKGKLIYRGSIGLQGRKGEQGEPGKDNVETGPKGEKGDDGKNYPYPGSLISEQADFTTQQDNRGIVSLSINPISKDENHLIAIRANIGDPNYCPKFIEPSDIKSKWILAVDERPIYKTILKNCGEGVCNIDNCQPNSPTQIIQEFCSSKLYYLDFSIIEKRLEERYQQLLQELKTTKEKVINYWLETMIKVYNEQKQALCCAIENCESRRENARERARIEDSRVLAATAQLGITVDGSNDKKWLETDAGKECADKPPPPTIDVATDTGIPTAISELTGGVEPKTIYSLTIDCKENAGAKKSSTIDLPPGKYLVDYDSCCCYGISRNLDLPDFYYQRPGITTNIINETESEWARKAPLFDKGDYSQFGAHLWDAARQNKPYSGSVNIIYTKGNGERISATLFPKESFRYLKQSQDYHLPESRRKIFGTANDIVIEHAGGSVMGFFPGVYNNDPRLEPWVAPSITKDLITSAYSGTVKLSFTRIPEPRPIPEEKFMETCEAGTITSVDINGETNVIPFIQYPTLNDDARKVINPFTYEPTGKLSGKPIILSMLRGSYELEVNSCCFFNSFIIQMDNLFLIITKEMYDVAITNDLVNFNAEWMKSKNDPRVEKMLKDYPPAIQDGKTIVGGCINDFELTKGFFNFPDPMLMIKMIPSYRAYRGTVTVVYPSQVDPNRPLITYVAKRTVIYTQEEKSTPSIFGGGKTFPGELEDETLYLDQDFNSLSDVYTVPIEEMGNDNPSRKIMKGKKAFLKVEDASSSFLGLKFQIDTSGGPIAIFIDDAPTLKEEVRELVEENYKRLWKVKEIFTPIEVATEGMMKLNLTCLETAQIDCDKTQMEVEIDCNQNVYYIENPSQTNPQKAASFELDAGSYVAELSNCCCLYKGGLFKGKVFLKYNRFKNLPSGITISPIEVLSNADFGEFLSEEEAFANYVGTSIAFGHAGGEVAIWVDTIVKQNNTSEKPVGKLKVRIQHKECYDFNSNIAEATGTEVEPVNVEDFNCDLPLSMIDQYEYQWRQNNICGFVVENSGSYWMILLRSIGNDPSCGGGESILSPCIEDAKRVFDAYPAISFPTLDGLTIAGKPTTVQRMLRDPSLSDLLISKLIDYDFVIVKTPGKVIYGSGKWPFSIEPPGRPEVISDADKLHISLNVAPKFGLILFPSLSI